MADRVDVTFSMTGRDLSFLAYVMKFISGGINDEDETIRGYWQVIFERAFDEHFENAEDETSAVMLPGHEAIAVTCSDGPEWRIPRLHRVIGYVTALGGNGDVLEKVAALSDHEGTLRVRRKAEPTAQEKGFFAKAWSSVIGDGVDTVDHEMP